MTKTELAQAKTQRLMILGALTEMPEDEQKAYQKARAALLKAIKPYGDPGSLALVVATLEVSIASQEDE